MTGRPSTLRLLWVQTVYQSKLFWRNPVSAFFTLAFPVMIFVVFSLVFGNEKIPYLEITVAQYYAPSLAVFAAVSATYTNLAITTSYQRDLGILKRIRGTPLPAWVYMGGKIISATYIAFIGIVIMIGVGVAFYGLNVYGRTMPAAILTFLVGSFAFSALGLFISAVAPSGQAATAVANATLLPLAFFSGIFIIPAEDSPTWLRLVGDFFPLKHFNDAFFAAFDPQRTDAAFEGGHLAYMVLWGVIAAALAIRWFTWEPTVGGSTTRRRRAARVPT